MNRIGIYHILENIHIKLKSPTCERFIQIEIKMLKILRKLWRRVKYWKIFCWNRILSEKYLVRTLSITLVY